MPETSRKSTRCRLLHGQSLTELALVLPLLMMIFFGMIEIGWWVHSWMTVATAAREGARYGSRGQHLSAAEIAEVTRVALSGTLDVRLTGADANTRILVTQIDVEPDGTYTVHGTFALGELAASSDVCLEGGCGRGRIDIAGARQANVVFNGLEAFCDEPEGCRADLIVVEAFYRHHMLTPVPFITDYVTEHIHINGRGVMRVLSRRGSF